MVALGGTLTLCDEEGVPRAVQSVWIDRWVSMAIPYETVVRLCWRDCVGRVYRGKPSVVFDLALRGYRRAGEPPDWFEGPPFFGVMNSWRANPRFHPFAMAWFQRGLELNVQEWWSPV